MPTPKKTNFLLPFAFSVVMILGMFFGIKFHEEIKGVIHLNDSGGSNKVDQILRLIDKKYVDSVDMVKTEEEAIQDLLSHLDPHSSYLPASELKKINEPLDGNFEGIGVEFYLLNDTIYVVSALAGGPSESLGIRSGDKIVKIDGKSVAGQKIKNSDVTSGLRGPSGTKVKISVLRKGVPKLIDFTITRGKIPLNSIDVAYMATHDIGFVKISTFGSTTYDEFYEAIVKLKEAGMHSLILDLRGNPGGYLNTAIMIADEFLGDKKLIVYTEGKASRRKEEYATGAGNFEKGKLIVLIDEGSASASEIVAGAVQDWDRGIVVGRRSFGKGLVQEQILLPDGSALRLTVARYYTPTGRCIQKSYSNGLDAYYGETYSRYSKGELLNQDSIRNVDSLKYRTPSGKIVYGGGGISPDVFIPVDTSDYSTFYSQLVSSGVLSEYCYLYVDQNKHSLGGYKDASQFAGGFQVSDAMFSELLAYAAKKGINGSAAALKRSGKAIKVQMKSLVGRQLFKAEGYYRSIQPLDKAVLKSIELLQAS